MRKEIKMECRGASSNMGGVHSEKVEKIKECSGLKQKRNGLDHGAGQVGCGLCWSGLGS
jgi:hypothetical protein